MSKLGMSKKPAVVRVTTEQRAQEILKLCNDNGWKVMVGIEPDKEEDISDVQKLLGNSGENIKTVVNDIKIGRNDLCPCGSMKKYKKCCGS